MNPRSIRDTQYRELTLEKSAINAENRTVEIALSSETPVERWFGEEILGHSVSEVDLSRMASGAPLLMDHNSRDLVGVVEWARLDNDRKLRCLVRFGKSARAEEVFQDVCDGIRQKVSVGYSIQRYETTKGTKGTSDRVRATLWTPLEASFVSVPADNAVGVGRSLFSQEANVPDDPQDSKTTPETPDTRTHPAPPAPTVPQPETRSLMTQEVRAFLAQAEKLFGVEGRATAEEILTQTQDLARAGQELLKARASKPLPAPNPSLEDLGASSRELGAYSYARALAYLVDQAEGRAVKRGFEAEVSETLARKMPVNFEARGGILVPLQVRALNTATTGGAKELVFIEKGELIPLLRNMAVCLKMGARFLTGLTGPLVLPKITGGATATWMDEDGATDVPSSQFATGSVTLTPKTLQASTPISRQLIIQSSEDAESLIRQDLATAHALAYDKAVLHGTGITAKQPVGIYNAVGVNVIAMGGAPTHGKLVDMVTESAVDNALLGTIGYVTNPRVAGKLMQTLVAAAAGSDMIWKGTLEEGTINGYRAVATNQVLNNMGAGTNEQGLISGNWAQVFMGQFGPGFELVVDPYSLKKRGLIEFTSFQMVDMALRYPEAFTKATGLIL